MQNKDWPNIAGLFGKNKSEVGILGAPMRLGCVTPSDYHLAPLKFRQVLNRISTYDVETGVDLDGLSIKDHGDINIKDLSPDDGVKLIKASFTKVIAQHKLSVLIGGHNGITYAGVHALDPSLQNIGLLTLDAHFDLRSTKNGLMNGNPVQALLDDGLPGHNITQIGIAPFANTASMHRTAIAAGINTYTMADCKTHSVVKIVETALKGLSNTCDVIYVDFDIDVIDRRQSPGAPGGRSGGFSTFEFFQATRIIGTHNKVKAVDLTEFDPALDINDSTALIAGRWFAELLIGYTKRP